MNKCQILSLFIAVLLVGCASAPTKDIAVRAVADPKVDFSGYKSYVWLGAASIVNDPLGQWEAPDFDADAEIKYLIDRELRKRDMTQNSLDPDLIVAFAAGIDMDALGLKVNPETKMKTLENVPQGGLLIALVDSKTGFVIWTGQAKAELMDQPDTDTVKARLDHAVTQLFRKIPN